MDDEQKFKVIQEGQQLKFADSETELVGMPDADGVIRGDFAHQGVGGGSFVLTPEAPSDDEAGFLQLDINKRQQVAADSVKVAALKAGTSFTGELNYQGAILGMSVDLTSETGGYWRVDHDENPDEQLFAVSHEGDRVKFFDSETELEGQIDAEGIVRGNMVHSGVADGTFVLTPNL
eukprot:gnl/TRDRNA2_/TRDRNA2_176727_c0_seq9.p2 gnl/TRDRNA2_/TRDRNA2_176727_c0~~gnl/TRDRNA2_/TRDRNA2_176727_c0_seq9.p2  ORF type:complete len:203 (-),score=58.20 gnl/TRDRNA2_/TRDRNA2_176727_c0_seq9:100-630(-)